MANFPTHLAVAAVGSGLLSTVCLGADIAEPEEVIILSTVGTLGGILPDIDLDHSSPTKLIFSALALVLAFLVVFHYTETYSILELWMIGGFVYVAIRYVGWRLFADFTVHRGIFHSVVAAVFFWFLITTIGYYLFDFNPLFAWIVGLFVFFGYIVHLILDELYSVDFMNNRIKRSFGTALKLFDYKNAKTSSLMAGAALVTYFMTPSALPFMHLLLNRDTYHNIMNRFLPDAMWFAL